MERNYKIINDLVNKKQYNKMNIFECMFSVKHNGDDVHTNITFLGITIKVRRN